MKTSFYIAWIIFISISGCKFNKQIPKQINQGKITSFKSTPLPESSLSILRGQVRDLNDSQPAPFAQMALYKDGAIVKSVVTDMDGNFKFSELETGNYILQIIASGYKSVDLNFKLKTPAEISMVIGIEQFQIRVEKPVIYLYPSEKKEITVQLKYQGKLTHCYPSYPKDGWKVLAEPNGTIWDKSGMEYYALFWEGIPAQPIIPKDGFIIEGGNTSKFLEEKLAYLGLNRREANEFIMYWLPQMENNAYNLIHFAGNDYNEQAELVISPKPETTIRIMMLTQPLKSKVEFPLQNLSLLKRSRKGFTVVEWGGSVISSIPF